MSGGFCPVPKYKSYTLTNLVKNSLWHEQSNTCICIYANLKWRSKDFLFITNYRKIETYNISGLKFWCSKSDLILNWYILYMYNVHIMKKILCIFQTPIVNSTSMYADDYEFSTIFKEYTARNGMIYLM